MGRRFDLVEIGFAAGIIVLGLIIMVDSFSIRLGVSYDRIGPRFFPYVVAAGLLLTGIIMLVDVLRGKGHVAGESFSKQPMLLLAIALIASVILFNRLGFIITVSIQFWLVARAFKSYYPVRDALTGIMLAVMVYLAFTSGLGLSLPQGVLSGLV